MKNPIPRSIWTVVDASRYVQILDQRFLPHKKQVNDLTSVQDCERAIKDMEVRGAPLIGITAAFGMYFACTEAPDDHERRKSFLKEQGQFLKASRPTAVNLMWAVDQMLDHLLLMDTKAVAVAQAWQKANELMEEDAEVCRSIGTHALKLIEAVAQEKRRQVVHILTHCNAGSLACIEWGTATSPIYQAHLKGIPVHVWVDETRPRNQGANLTAWELNEAGVPHSLVVDNTGGHLMQHGQVDLVFVGADRVTRNGDAANKIGTYLKALAASDNQVPFYVCLPTSTIDWEIGDGVKEIEIEERTGDEVRFVQGKVNNELVQVQICPDDTPAFNVGFDVTPSRLITGLVTERGICEASADGLAVLYPERHQVS